MDNLEIADRIKKRCKGMKISVKSLLDDCGINHGFIYDLEHKNSAPSIDKINKIANYLNCSVDYLLGRVDDPHSEIPVALSAPQGYENLTDEQKELIQALIDQYAQRNKE